MEEQLGIKLFIRQSDGFVLTETGEALVERAERVESEILSLEREVFGRDALLAGPVRISAPPLLAQHLLMPILADFAELYPNIEIEIDATFEVADLRRRNADIAIRFQVEPEPGLIAHGLPDFANSIYATPAYIVKTNCAGPECSGKWIVLGGKEVLAHWRQDSPYSTCKVQHIVTDMQTHVEAVKSGMGFGYLLCFVANSDPDLKRLPNAPIKSIAAWILTHPDSSSTERVRTCARFLTDEIWKREKLIVGS